MQGALLLLSDLVAHGCVETRLTLTWPSENKSGLTIHHHPLDLPFHAPWGP